MTDVNLGRDVDELFVSLSGQDAATTLPEVDPQVLLEAQRRLGLPINANMTDVQAAIRRDLAAGPSTDEISTEI